MLTANKLNTVNKKYIHNIDKQRWSSIKEYPYKIYLIHIYITNIQNNYTQRIFK